MMPKEFDVIAAKSCDEGVNADWQILASFEDDGFNELNEAKHWIIPQVACGTESSFVTVKSMLTA